MGVCYGSVVARKFLLAVVFLLSLAVEGRLQQDCRERIPNGHRIPFRQGISGRCSREESVTSTPSCYGGAVTLDRNPFGQDFAAAGYKWTRKLCRKDSDGDGLSNGEELGDPCCIWRENAEIPDWMQDLTISHPGFANSTFGPNDSTIDVPTVCNGAKPLPNKRFYNKGEERIVLMYPIEPFPFSIEDSKAQQKVLVYQDFVYDLPDNFTYDIVGIERWFDDEEFLEYVVYHDVSSCQNKAQNEGRFREVDALEVRCLETMYTWSKGSTSSFIAPKSTGFRAGKESQRVGFTARLVYMAPTIETNITIVKSGLKFHVTPNHREHELGAIRVDFRTRLELIPPDSNVAESTLTQIKVDRKIAPGGARLVGYVPGPTQHFQLCKKWLERLKRTSESKGLLQNFKELDKDEELGRDIEWFSDKLDYYLNTGDYLSSTCVYDSTNMASSPELEGCHSTLYYYPAGAMNQVIRYAGPKFITPLSEEEVRSIASVMDIIKMPISKTELPLWRSLYLGGTFRCNPDMALASLTSTELTPGVTDSLFQLEVKCKQGAGIEGIEDKARLQFDCTEDCAVLLYNTMACPLISDSKLEDGEILSLFPAPLEGIIFGICGQTFSKIYDDFQQGVGNNIAAQYGLYSMVNSTSLTGGATLVLAILTIAGILAALW